MIFDIGDIVVCTSWDKLPKNKGINILELCGYSKNESFIVLDIFDETLIFNNGIGNYADKMAIHCSYFTKLDDIRNNKLKNLLQ
jgi:hypothetical protein